jgi:hypothetical protein
MSARSDQRRSVGRKWLGPVFAEFARRLELYMAATPDPSAVALYCARGGFRLRTIHERWLQRMELPSTKRHEDFMVSRLLATKIALLPAPQVAIESLYREFSSQSLRTLTLAFLNEVDAAEADLSAPRLAGTSDAEGIKWLFFGDHPLARLLRLHADDQTILFADHLSTLRRTASRMLIVDSGLYGHTQLLLEAARPDVNWHGVYFARSNYSREPAPHFQRATGLILELDEFSFLIPEAAFLRYWHLVEAVLEPSIPSVRWLERRPDGSVGSNMDSVAWQHAVSDDGNPLFAGVIDYIDQLGPTDRQHSRAHFREAMHGLQRAILSPRLADLDDMDVGRARPRLRP